VQQQHPVTDMPADTTDRYPVYISKIAHPMWVAMNPSEKKDKYTDPYQRDLQVYREARAAEQA